MSGYWPSRAYTDIKPWYKQGHTNCVHAVLLVHSSGRQWNVWLLIRGDNEAMEYNLRNRSFNTWSPRHSSRRLYTILTFDLIYIDICSYSQYISIDPWNVVSSKRKIWRSSSLTPIRVIRDQFYWHGLTSIPTWISSHIPTNRWSLGIFIPYFMMDAITAINFGTKFKPC